MKKIIIVCFCVLSSLIIQAQIDTEFWFVAPEVSSQHGDQPIFLRFTAFSQAALVTVSQPANPNFAPMTVSVAANSTQSLNLTSFISLVENLPANQVLQKGLLIQSTTKISAYYEVANQFNPEIFPLKGKNALGQRFFIPAQNTFANQVGSAAFDIIASENNTNITVTVTDIVTGHAANSTFTITLNKGETYSIRSTNTSATGHLGGSLVTSNKPIAITVSDDSIFQGGAYDLIGDQIVPVNIIGTEYIAIKGQATTERVYIVATEDNTSIYYNGNATPNTTINAGALISFPITGNTLYITSSAPIYVLHLSGHATEIGDALLPPITCTGSDEIGFVRSSTGSLDLMVLTQSGNEGNFIVNGSTTLLQASNFSAVPGTNNTWMSARLSVSVGQIPVGSNFIENTSGLFHLGILNNLGLSSEYGYFSNYSTLNLGDDNSICDGDILTLDAGDKKGSYLWNTGDTTRKIDVTQPGIYSVTTSFYGCALKDTIVVNVNYVDVDLGSDTSICHYDNITLDATSANTSVTYEWHDSSASPTFVVPDSGKYYVTLIDTLGCTDSDTINIAYNSQVSIGNDTSFVCDSINYLLYSGLNSGTFLWQDSSTLPYFLVTNIGTYHVSVIDDSGCFSSDTSYVTFNSSPDTELGNDTLLCEGATIDLDALIDLAKAYVWQDSSSGRFHTVSEPGTYYVKAIDWNNCFDEDTIQIDYFLSADITLGEDTTLCDGNTFNISPNYTTGIQYEWQDGTLNFDYDVTTAGSYHVAVTNHLNCIARDTINLDFLSPPQPPLLPTDTTVCLNTFVTFDATTPEATSYFWEGFSPYFGYNNPEDSVFTGQLAGEYKVTIGNRCGNNTYTIELITEDCSCHPFIPNAFTPNGDGNNDQLEIYSNCLIEDIRFEIYDRWGNLVYLSEEVADGWNGTIRGIDAIGVFVWRLTYTSANKTGEMQSHQMTGDVTIIR